MADSGEGDFGGSCMETRVASALIWEFQLLPPKSFLSAGELLCANLAP